MPPCGLTYQDDLIWMKCSFWAKFFAAFGILRISLEAAEICQYKPWRRPISKSFLYLKIHPKFKNQQKIWPKTYIWVDFGQWVTPNKGENWPQSFKFWKSDVLYCSSGVPALIPSSPEPEMFLRTCLTIARYMVKTIGRSLGSKNWPQSRKNQQKTAKIDVFWKKLENRVLHAEMAYFTSSGDPDSYFMVKIAIFRGPGWYLAVLGCHLYMSVLVVYLCDVLF